MLKVEYNLKPTNPFKTGTKWGGAISNFRATNLYLELMEHIE